MLYYKAENKRIALRLTDMFHPPEEIDAEEVISNVFDGAGLTFK